MHRQETSSIPYMDNSTLTSSSTDLRPTSEQENGGKKLNEVPRTPTPHSRATATDNNPFFEESNPFLTQLTRPSQPRPHQRQQNLPTTSQKVEDNPFLVTTKPTQIKRQSAAVTQSSYGSSDFAHLRDPSGPASAAASSRHANTATDSSLNAHHQSSRSNSSRGRSSKDTFDYQNASLEDLKKARIELKTWEANFKATHQRAATQDDIAKDETMVKKYRAYGKIKKALAAKDAKKSEEILKPPEGTMGFTDLSNSREPPRTPTKQLRTHQSSAVTRTPTRKQEVEFVSPRKVVSNVGLMSPSKVFKGMDDEFRLGTSSPTSKRTVDMLKSPSRGSSRRSLLRSPSFKSPSSLFVIGEFAKDGIDEAAHLPTSETSLPTTHTMDGLILPGSTTPSRMPRTPTSKKIGSLYLPNPFQSPTRSRTSPLFGGMNNRKPKRTARLTAPVAEDLEPEVIQDQINRNTSPIIRIDEVTSDTHFMKSPIISTPQKSGAAKAARSLFRRPNASYPTSPSSHRSQPNAPLSKSPSLYGAQHVYESKDDFLNSPFQSLATDQLQESVHDAMDSMSIREYDRHTPSKGRITHGFDIDDQWNDVDDSSQPHDDARLHSPSEDRMIVNARMPHNLMSPSKSHLGYLSTTPRTPSQQPSLTFSQTTPGSAKSEADILVVPAGFHSHYRRRPGRPMILMASQEEDEQFEKEFLVSKTGKQSGSAFGINDSGRGYGDDGVATAVSNNEPGDEDDWEEQESGSDGQEESQFGPAKKALPRKKYTQKRTTKLHRIAVAPSEKAELTRPIRALRKRKTAKAQAESVEPEASENKEDCEVVVEKTGDVTSEGILTSEVMKTKSNSVSKDESTVYGWANSNKPMIKSDKRIPGVGLGRAGPRRLAASKFGGPSSDGNFVAYNLQRGGFKKGGARGRSRFGGSKFGSYGVGGPGTGRTLFDDESWRTEFDKDFDDSTLAMSFVDGGLAVEDEDEADDEMPWYGNVNDITDPFVVTVSKKYLRGRIGDINDPEEYVEELEGKNLTGDTDAHQEEGSQGFKVNLEHILKKVWGYPSFRDGQLDSIKRTLNYESSLIVLPTGSGKSLSYQLPAYIFSKLGVPSLTLVVSPMISLMYDQVKCLPPGLTGACWTSVEQSASQFKDFMEKLTSNTIKILFISPEKLQSQSFLSLVRTRIIPPISFLCVDEVHCLSEWSHNFRPAYLLLNHVLKTDLKSPCVLGLTGTATEGTKDSICAMLDIDRMTGVLSGPVIRENLAMTVSLEMDRETALLNLLQSPRFASMNSILIYVMKQAQADILAGFLRVRNFSAESYHAGKSPQDRQRIQHRFMSDGPQKSVAGVKVGSGSISTGGSTNGIRILVATIAFGLGLNKSNIRSVIHYCMPKSLENYIQEIGRSGRDGEKAYCHMFLNQDDYLRLRSLAYADGMDWGSVLRLIKKLFSRRDIANKSSAASHGKEALNAAGKKRRGPTKSNDPEDEDNEEERWGDESSDEASAKKLKQNNHQPLKIKTPKAGSNGVLDQRSLVMSTAAILAIPPTPGMLLGNVMGTRRKRLVVVREELIEEEFDIKKEVLATLLSYIELDSSHPIKVLGPISAKCTVKFLQTPEALSELADSVPLIDMIIKQGVLTGNNSNRGASSSYGKGRRQGNRTGLAGTTLSMAYCCDTMSLCQQSNMTYTELVQEMQLWKRKKWIVFELTDPALCVEILKEPAECMVEYRRQQQRQSGHDMDIEVEVSGVAESSSKLRSRSRASSSSRVIATEMEPDTETYEKNHDDFIVSITDRLHRKLCAVERVGVAKVDQVYELFHSVATPTWQQQEVFQSHSQDSEDEDDYEEAGEGEESSEYDEDADPEYVQMRARAKAQARAKARSRKNRSSTFNGGVSESEMILREGIQTYFAKHSGEGIGGLGAEEELFQKQVDATLGNEEAENLTTGGAVAADKTIQMYSYENAIVTNLQRKWRSAVEVDLKVFLNQHWQQQQQQSAEYGASGNKGIDSPRVVSRIFHGISSPCYSALEWSRSKYWAKYVHFDFAQLMQMTDRIIKEQRQQRLSQK